MRVTSYITIDEAELSKFKFSLDMKIKIDAKIFINLLTKTVHKDKLQDYEPWIEKCNQWKIKYLLILKLANHQ
jgi:hypothetical protein